MRNEFNIVMYARVKLCGGRKAIEILRARHCSTNSCHVDNIEPKPFEDIPGPRSLPVIGTLYKYLPFIGKNNAYFDDRLEKDLLLL